MAELLYNDRQALTEGEDATLVYSSPYTGTEVTQHVTVTDTTGSVTVELDDGTVWGVMGNSIRTTENSRRASGTVEPKNGRTVGYLTSLQQ